MFYFILFLRNFSLVTVVALIFSFLFSSCTTTSFCRGGNFHLIDKDDKSGFAIYRSAWPDENLIKEYCKQGITEIMVLSGNSESFENKFKEVCPSLKVIYNEKQDPRTPLNADFLNNFDQWILQAKQSGKKVAIRCNCGSHRTGRLAAYYQMKYQNLTSSDAKAILGKHGMWMFLYPDIYEQVDALYDYIRGNSSSVKKDNKSFNKSFNKSDVKILIGATPIKDGVAIGEKDITLLNDRLAVSFSVTSPSPWGVARGGIIDAAIVEHGVIGKNHSSLIDFMPNNWSSWPTTYQRVEIVKDSADEAIIKTTRDWNEIILETIFSLKRGDNKIHVITTMTNNGSKIYSDILSGYILWTNGGYHFETPGLKDLIKGPSTGAFADWVISYDRDWMIAIHAPFFDNINYNAKDMYLKHTLIPAEKRTFEGWIQFEANADISKVLASEIERKKIDYGILEGKFPKSVNSKSPAIVVKKDGQIYTWCLGESQYSLKLPIGKYRVYAVADGFSPTKEVELEIKNKGEKKRLDFLKFKKLIKVIFQIKDKISKAPLFSKVTIEEGPKPAIGFLGKKTFFSELNLHTNLNKRKSDEIILFLPAGKYLFKLSSAGKFLSKDELIKVDIDEKKKKIVIPVQIENKIKPSEKKWYSADLHHHSNILDGMTSPKELVRSQLAAGTDLIFISDHDSINNCKEIQQIVKNLKRMFICGMEISPSWGHFNAYPVKLGEKLKINPANSSFEEIIKEARRMDAKIFSINHPNASTGYFFNIEKDSSVGGGQGVDKIGQQIIDLVEANSFYGKVEDSVKRLYKFWNQNKQIYLVAGTDTHDVLNNDSGKIRTFVHINGKADEDKFISSLKEGHSYVSFGPIIYPLSNQSMFGGKIIVEHSNSVNNSIILDYSIFAVSGIKSIELLSGNNQNKESEKGIDVDVVETISIAEDGVTSKNVSFKIKPDTNTVANTKWYSLRVKDNLSGFAWTNPIWIVFK
ncbi:MAG: CehA/McbA family metallohydrolase [Oligoflexia bacterium]|nr:CehA/McbA family metallohydrolase [Oligoflexia bacterium]